MKLNVVSHIHTIKCHELILMNALDQYTKNLILNIDILKTPLENIIHKFSKEKE